MSSPLPHQDVARLTLQGPAKPVKDVQADRRRLPRLDAADARPRHPHHLGELFLAQPGGLALIDESNLHLWHRAFALPPPYLEGH